MLINKKYRINPEFSLIFKKDQTLLCVNTTKNIKKISVDANEIDDVVKILNNETFEKSNSKIFKKLFSLKIIVNNNDNINYELYLNQFLTSNVNIDDLYNKKIAIIGLGGMGSEILNHLLGVGIRKYMLIDFDKIEKTNFNRQYLFNMNDIKKTKIDVIENIIKNRVENSEIQKFNKKILSSTDLLDIFKQEVPDIIICAADTPFLDLRIAIIETSIKLKTPCVFGGVSILDGQYGPYLISNKNKNNYLNELIKFKTIVAMNNTNKASFGPTNSIISSYMAMDIIFGLLGYKRKITSLNKIITVNFESGNSYETKQF